MVHPPPGCVCVRVCVSCTHATPAAMQGSPAFRALQSCTNIPFKISNRKRKTAIDLVAHRGRPKRCTNTHWLVRISRRDCFFFQLLKSTHSVVAPQCRRRHIRGGGGVDPRLDCACNNLDHSTTIATIVQIATIVLLHLTPISPGKNSTAANTCCTDTLPYSK